MVELPLFDQVLRQILGIEGEAIRPMQRRNPDACTDSFMGGEHVCGNCGGRFRRIVGAAGVAPLRAAGGSEDDENKTESDEIPTVPHESNVRRNAGNICRAFD